MLHQCMWARLPMAATITGATGSAFSGSMITVLEVVDIGMTSGKLVCPSGSFGSMITVLEVVDIGMTSGKLV